MRAIVTDEQRRNRTEAGLHNMPNYQVATLARNPQLRRGIRQKIRGFFLHKKVCP